MDVNICFFYPFGSFHKRSSPSCNNDRSVTPNVCNSCCKFRFQRFERCSLTRRGNNWNWNTQLKRFMAAHKRSSRVVSFHFLSRGQSAFDRGSLCSPHNPAQVILDFAFLFFSHPLLKRDSRRQRPTGRQSTLVHDGETERMRKFLPKGYGYGYTRSIQRAEFSLFVLMK